MSETIPVHLLPATPTAGKARKTPAQTGEPIHTRSFTGRFRNWRLAVAGSLAVLFFGTSWLNMEGRQAVLWDLGERKFHVFNATFWPQDLTLLSALLIISAFALFAVTVYAGRIWCGYACPQSTWTWAFMWAEKVTEGDRLQRIKLDKTPWSFNKLAKRTAKHGLWLAMSLATGIAFIGYFVPVRELTADILTGQWFTASAFWVFFIALFTYGNAGWLREKVCVHMCPYARFQAVMYDKDTLAVSYNPTRGENRGSRKKEEDYQAKGLGDCVDCYLCVQVCPTGIDIRDGLQIDCIGCAACIDACDSVMDKMDYPRGLISYASERTLAGEAAPRFRPRLLGYVTAVILMCGALAFTVYDRELTAVNVIKDRTLYRKNSEGHIVNVYRLKLMNKTHEAAHYHIALRQPDDGGLQLQRQYRITLASGEIVDLPVSVVQQNGSLYQGAIPFTFVVQNNADGKALAEGSSTFVFPTR